MNMPSVLSMGGTKAELQSREPRLGLGMLEPRNKVILHKQTIVSGYPALTGRTKSLQTHPIWSVHVGHVHPLRRSFGHPDNDAQGFLIAGEHF